MGCRHVSLLIYNQVWVYIYIFQINIYMKNFNLLNITSKYYKLKCKKLSTNYPLYYRRGHLNWVETLNLISFKSRRQTFDSFNLKKNT